MVYFDKSRILIPTKIGLFNLILFNFCDLIQHQQGLQKKSGASYKWVWMTPSVVVFLYEQVLRTDASEDFPWFFLKVNKIFGK